ncbi:MAG: 3-oxoacyl-ACP synthase [Chitinophagaceae bacterium]|nr:MAG: 3-oxoacyl-ACP synthase [Chitinophagaceae bacterium]
MQRSIIAGVGHYVPKNVYTNTDLSRFMDTNDAWIRERTGIEERRFADRNEETTTTMGIEAAKIAIERAGITKDDVDFIIFATLSPDYYFPGCGVLLQREMGMREVGALDIRNQCSGFVYALSVADQFIKTGMYKNILIVGSEKHSFAMDFESRSRNVSVIFGDGAGAVVLQPTTVEGQGILSTHLHSDGADAEILAMHYPGSHANKWLKDKPPFPDQELGGLFMTGELLDSNAVLPYMDGPSVFKKAVEGPVVMYISLVVVSVQSLFVLSTDRPIVVRGNKNAISFIDSIFQNVKFVIGSKCKSQYERIPLGLRLDQLYMHVG